MLQLVNSKALIFAGASGAVINKPQTGGMCSPDGKQTANVLVMMNRNQVTCSCKPENFRRMVERCIHLCADITLVWFQNIIVPQQLACMASEDPPSVDLVPMPCMCL